MVMTTGAWTGRTGDQTCARLKIHGDAVTLQLAFRYYGRDYIVSN